MSKCVSIVSRYNKIRLYNNVIKLSKTFKRSLGPWALSAHGSNLAEIQSCYCSRVLSSGALTLLVGRHEWHLAHK